MLLINKNSFYFSLVFKNESQTGSFSAQFYGSSFDTSQSSLSSFRELVLKYYWGKVPSLKHHEKLIVILGLNNASEIFFVQHPHFKDKEAETQGTLSLMT